MSVLDLETTRQRLRQDGEISAELLTELRTAIASTVRRLPTAMSPYGNWDAEAINDVLAGWLAGKALHGDQLLVLLDRARTVASLRRMTERSVYHWLLAQRERTHAQNIYHRLVEVLSQEGFLQAQDARRSGDRAYALAATPRTTVFSGSDRQLHAAGWAQGELTLLHYSGSERRSPLIRTSQLRDFAAGVIRVLDAAVTVNQLMIALGGRIDLGDTTTVRGDVALRVADESALADNVILREAAKAVLGLLSERQQRILIGTADGMTGKDLASELRCSNSTVTNEQRRIGELVDRFAESTREREAILQLVVEALDLMTRNRQVPLSNG